MVKLTAPLVLTWNWLTTSPTSHVLLPARETLREMLPGGMPCRASSRRILSMVRPPQPVRLILSGREVCHCET